MSRVYNFSAGPSMLPLEVLERAQKEMLDCNGSGQSVMEMSHRSKDYQAIIDEADALLREIMNIPDNYKVMFLQGGASTQFAMVPMNLATKNKKADYVITGQWARKLTRKQVVISRQTLLHQVQIRPSPTSPMLTRVCLPRVLTLFILHTTTPSTVHTTTQCPTLATQQLLPICPPVSFPKRLTSQSSVLSMPALRRIWALQVLLLLSQERTL